LRKGSKAGLADAGRETGAEFTQNFAEGVKSGDPAAVITETIAAAGSYLGPVGLTLAGAFGIGAAIVSEINASRERAYSAAKGLYEAVRSGAYDAAAKEEFVNNILGTEDFADARKKIAPQARLAGVSIGDVVAEIESGGDAATGLDAKVNQAIARLKELGDNPGPQQVAAALGPAGKAALELAGYYEQGAKAIADANYLLTLQKDIAINNVREVERAGRTARGVTNFERSEWSGYGKPGG
jgi:hypothetical protein